MARTIPDFTLPLCAFNGFSKLTQEALENLFGTDLPTGPLRALVMRPRGTTNTSDPHEVGFLIQTADGHLKTASAFSAPADIMSGAAAAAYMVSHDPFSEMLTASMRMNCRQGSHGYVAVTGFGAVSWAPRTCHAVRKDHAEFEKKLDQGNALLAFVATRHARSAHQQMTETATFGALADSIYGMVFDGKSSNARTGIYSRVRFTPEQVVRNPQMGPT